MTSTSQGAILNHLEHVAEDRRLRDADGWLAERVQAIKRWQISRFERSYADLLDSSRYGRAARFFLEELYGPGDFSSRDQQFARVIPALVRLFPREIILTVQQLAELHALSEQLDTLMAGEIASAQPSRVDYASAWRNVGRPDWRERQIELMQQVGKALDRYTHKPLMRHSLRVMRVPAKAAGLGTLQDFLERGFDTFRAMGGADEFLQTIACRERDFGSNLFTSDA